RAPPLDPCRGQVDGVARPPGRRPTCAPADDLGQGPETTPAHRMLADLDRVPRGDPLLQGAGQGGVFQPRPRRLRVVGRPPHDPYFVGHRSFCTGTSPSTMS